MLMLYAVILNYSIFHLSIVFKQIIISFCICHFHFFFSLSVLIHPYSIRHYNYLLLLH